MPGAGIWPEVYMCYVWCGVLHLWPCLDLPPVLSAGCEGQAGGGGGPALIDQ